MPKHGKKYTEALKKIEEEKGAKGELV